MSGWWRCGWEEEGEAWGDGVDRRGWSGGLLSQLCSWRLITQKYCIHVHHHNGQYYIHVHHHNIHYCMPLKKKFMNFSIRIWNIVPDRRPKRIWNIVPGRRLKRIWIIVPGRRPKRIWNVVPGRRPKRIWNIVPGGCPQRIRNIVPGNALWE